MEIIRTTALTENQKEKIRHITDECRKIHPFSLSFPLEEDAVFYLLCDPEPVCALALLLPEETSPDSTAECVAFTLPSRQRQGCFSTLFRRAEEEVTDTDLLFLTDGSDEGALKTLQSLGAEFEYREHRMDLNLLKRPVPALKPEDSRLTVRTEASENGLTFSFFIQTEQGASPAGVCRFAVYETGACLYGLEIAGELRGRGLGYEALLIALNHMNGTPVKNVFLQVSGENSAAIRLYEKTGFRISETLSCYLY